MGAIINIDASVATTVQELIDGSPGSVSADADQTGADDTSVPLTASSDLVSTDLEGVLVSMAQAFGTFEDPTRLDQANPEEFGVEVGCYSNGDSLAYAVSSRAVESRTIVFTTEGSDVAPPEIEFSAFGTQLVESRVFISGAVIFWSTQSDQALADMTSELSVTVRRDDTNAVLFASTLTLTGDAAGQVGVDTSGAIVVERLDPSDLLDAGVDEDTVAMLQDIADTAALVVLAIPEQEHAYTYTVTANAAFDLTAELTVTAGNIPGGTGVAATLGRPFENLAAFVEEGLPGVDGASLESSLNATTKSLAVGLVQAETPTVGSQLCGALGFETALMLGLFSGVIGLRRR